MRIVLAEDLPLLREGLTHMLEARGFEIVEAVASGGELAAALRTHRPDLAIVDVRLPPTFTDEGLRAALAARRETPGLPVLVLSQHVEQLYAHELLADGGGAIGYLLKDRVLGGEQFIDALNRVAAGGTALDPDVISALLSSSNRQEPLGSLTAREREVLELMTEGRSNAAIAQRLHLSDGAISKYTTSIFAKLGIADSPDDNRRVLAVLAYLDGNRS
ncbi:two component transcriptional regulator, LuxR family [Prauserella aidingensis]|uniref:response regulator transcription factor n=1 Tax=Prauserella aidingensis TaxID=387890 RepID=UPI0020A2FC3E|nr:response regulator transcription factor [Prauserella aidingensis]MCP2253997.1 two component transcriptional regulator, LuxR family [Prauserella aidingensis]